MDLAKVVELEHVSKEYGADKVVDDVSFAVTAGEIFVLIGPSGCGKTTTLKMINQLIPHTAGKILVKGQDVTKLDPVELRRSIGYVIQYIGLLPHLTIQDNITFVLQLKKYPRRQMRDRARELIQTVGLPVAYLDRHPRELSGGQQQRIGVARALAADPEILLMDEPYGAIDPITREQLQNDLLGLQETLKKTIIFVTHDMQEAFKVGNRIAIMRDGKMVASGSAMDIVKSQDEFVLNFIGHSAIFDALNAVPVSRVLTLNVPKVNQGHTLAADTTGWESVFVLDSRGVCAGTVNLSGLNETGKIPEDHLVPLPKAVQPSLSVKKAIEEMLWTGRTYMPVVAETGAFLGIVTFEACAALMSS
jgi:osmoprotectant transport system ATP-binding protein